MSAGEQHSDDVRIYAIRKRQGKRGATYVVRWRVSGTDHQQTFTTTKLADGYRADLLAAARGGERFSLETGLPRSMTSSSTSAVTWLDHGMDFIEMKWPDAAPKYRKSLAESLTKISVSLTGEAKGRPADADLRRFLFKWAFNPPSHAGPPPADLILASEWIRRTSVPIADLEDVALIRSVLSDLAINLDGTSAAISTVARRRAAFHSALDFAVERRLLSVNPLNEIRRKRVPPVPAIDPRRVANSSQVRALLSAAREQDPELEAFFATMYFAGPRPGEVLNLRADDMDLPATGWGELLLASSYQRPGADWTDSGDADEERELKHRAIEDTRPVPAHPELVETLRRHIKLYEIAPDGRLFVARNGPRGYRLPPHSDKPVSMNTVYRAWQRARIRALTAKEAKSSLARRPYDLRHACLSTWLNAGVSPVQVAEWAGHSVAVLLSVYAKCIDGEEMRAKQRIEDALRRPE